MRRYQQFEVICFFFSALQTRCILRQFGANQFNQYAMRWFDEDLLSYYTGGYGCWCYFGSEWSHAGGAVQDEYDAICKQLITGYRCARIDAMLTLLTRILYLLKNHLRAE